ncbi:adhesive plaque matrix protein-like [Paramacrobiotus metropolitanus]|uniref:adhesive plaque matrix protein-like n=1 Tax=Paramacrobiotus metropolitanus TaxID=2943436 RepID=UPI0024462EC8|nr:adhesive plaque matrix protein-like [Paramacrobiotus metropolitanus]
MSPENLPRLYLLMAGLIPVVWLQKVSPAINTKSTTIIQSPTLKIQPFSAATSYDPKIADLKLYDFSSEANRRKPQLYNKRYTEMEKPYYTKTYEGKGPEKVSYEIKVYIPKHFDLPPAYPATGAPDAGQINKSAYVAPYEIPATEPYPGYNYEAYPIPSPPKYDSKMPYGKPYYPDEKAMYEPKPAYYPNYYESKPVVYEKPISYDIKAPVYEKPMAYNYEKPVYEKKPVKYVPEYEMKYNEIPYQEPYPKTYPEPVYEQKTPRYPEYTPSYEPKYEVKPKYVEPYAPAYEHKPVKYETNAYEQKPPKPEVTYSPANSYEPKGYKEPSYIPYQKPAYPEKAGHYDKSKPMQYDFAKSPPSYEQSYYPAASPPMYYQPPYQPMYYYYYPPKPYEMPSPPPYYPPAPSTYQYYATSVPPATTHSTYGYAAYSNY